MQLFNADPIVFSKRKNIFFDPKNMKKLPSKVAHNPNPNFFMYWPGCPNGPETEIPYHQKPIFARLGIQTGVAMHMIHLTPNCERNKLGLFMRKFANLFISRNGNLTNPRQSTFRDNNVRLSLDHHNKVRSFMKSHFNFLTL